MHVGAFSECRFWLVFWLVLAGCKLTVPILFESFLDTIIIILPPLFASGFIFSDCDIIFRCRPQGSHRAPLVRVFQIRPLLQCRETCSVLCGFPRASSPFWCYTNATINASIFRFMSVHPVYPFFRLSICVSSQGRHHPYLVPSLLSKPEVHLNKSTSIAIAEITSVRIIRIRAVTHLLFNVLKVILAHLTELKLLLRFPCIRFNAH